MEGPQVHVPPAGGPGKLAENVMHFARVLRSAGLPVGPGKVLDALAALEIAGVERRDDFYWTLAAVFVDRREQFEIFDQAFHIFWRDPKLLERVMSLFLPQVQGARPGRAAGNVEPARRGAAAQGQAGRVARGAAGDRARRDASRSPTARCCSAPTSSR